MFSIERTNKTRKLNKKTKKQNRFSSKINQKQKEIPSRFLFRVKTKGYIFLFHLFYLFFGLLASDALVFCQLTTVSKRRVFEDDSEIFDIASNMNIYIVKENKTMEKRSRFGVFFFHIRQSLA